MLTIQQEAQLTQQSEDTVRSQRAAHASARAWEQAQLSVLEPSGAVDILYGSQQWLALPLDDPCRAAALLRAAAAWREHSAGLAERIICQAETDIAIAEQLRAEVTEEVRAECAAQQAEDWRLIAGWAKGLASVPTVEEQDKLRRFAPIREIRATSGWPPVAIPGRPGWRRHLVEGKQVDLPAAKKLEAAA